MSHKIVHKASNSTIGVVSDLSEINVDNLIKANGGVTEDFDIIEISTELSIEQQKQNILSQLAQLDLIVPRIIEDIYNQSVPQYTLHQSKLYIMEQKQALRAQLSELEV